MKIDDIDKQIIQNNLMLSTYKMNINVIYGNRGTPININGFFDKILDLRFENYRLEQIKIRLKKINQLMK